MLRPSVRFEVSPTDSSVLQLIDCKPPSASASASASATASPAPSSTAAGAGAAASNPNTLVHEFRLVEGSSAGASVKHPRFGTLIDDDADGWLQAFKLQRALSYQKRMAALKPKDERENKAVLNSIHDLERRRRDASELVRRGAVFRKFKRGSAKERWIWCSDTCDRIFWGDKKKQVIKGYIMMYEIVAVQPGMCVVLSLSWLHGFTASPLSSIAWPHFCLRCPLPSAYLRVVPLCVLCGGVVQACVRAAKSLRSA